MGVTRTHYWGNGYRTKEVIKPKFSKEVTSCYKDVMEKAKEQSRTSKKSVKYSAAFDGIIPDEARNKIIHAEPFFDEIFIVAEVNHWDIKEMAPAKIKRVDPLVVGYDGHHYRLITAFDLSPIEKVVQDRLNGVKSS
jgi:hypothetical protein